MIDISKTRFIVTAWPDHRWPVQVVHFIEEMTKGIEVRKDYRESIVKRDRTCARNHAIRHSALGSDPHYESFIFVDADVRPGAYTGRFLQLDADIKCCQVPMKSEMAWSWPTYFHDALWCASREALEKIEPPWFMQGYSKDGTELDGCICHSFREKALAAGLTIAHGGWAEHDKDGSWCG